MPAEQGDSTAARLVLALDIGTSSARSLLFDADGTAVPGTEAQTPYEMTTTVDGAAELDPDRLFHVVAACLDRTLSAILVGPGQIVAVGISCFWHSLLGLDASGTPTTPVFLWADTRSAVEVEKLRRVYDRYAVHQRTGCVIHSSYWPAKLRWLRYADPTVFGATTRWCAFSDYLLRRLSGADLTSISMASGTGLLDIRSGTWDLDAVEMSDISIEALPRIAAEDEMVRGVKAEYAARWPALATVPWLPGAGDGACANVGTGAVGSDRIALSLGTSGAMRVVIEHGLGDPLDVPAELWAYRLDHRRIVIGAAISNGGKVLAWLAELLGIDFDGADLDLVGDLEPDAHGLTILPFLAGERSPIWNDRATAVIAGLNLSTDRLALIRAGMESVSLRFARLYESMCAVAAARHEIVANGGAILRSPAWLQITADALRHTVIALPPDDQSSARGAAVLALLASGALEDLGTAPDPAYGATTVEPRAAGMAAYLRALDRQRELERLLFPSGTSWETTASNP